MDMIIDNFADFFYIKTYKNEKVFSIIFNQNNMYFLFVYACFNTKYVIVVLLNTIMILNRKIRKQNKT